eukprot:2293901-Pyramimonas_sp.AAC.1
MTVDDCLKNADAGGGEKSISMCVVADAWPPRSGNDVLPDGCAVCSGRTRASEDIWHSRRLSHPRQPIQKRSAGEL